MSWRASETSASSLRLLELITKHCGKISVAKKETSELVDLCHAVRNRLSPSSPTPQLSDDMISELVKVEKQLSRWSEYNYPKSLMNKKAIEEGITGFIATLDTINRALPPPQAVEPEAPDSAYRLPPVKRLNGKVEKIRGGTASTGWEPEGDMAFTGGPHCEIWKGLWDKEGEEGIGGGGVEAENVKVALKALRITKMSERTYEKLEHDLPIWVRLSHKNVLPFYGTAEIGRGFYMVSPWRENGNLLAYVRNNPQSNKNELLCGSAEGLCYLHSKNVVHGRVQCNNVLITQEGHPQICDFGIAGIMQVHSEDATSNAKTVSSAEIVRYAAPELIENTDSSPTMESDTYSFAMLIVECITEDVPFSNITRDAAVIHARINKKQCPPRPEGPEGKKYVSDGLWDLMNRCWSLKPDKRPSMEHVHSFFKELVEPRSSAKRNMPASPTLEDKAGDLLNKAKSPMREDEARKIADALEKLLDLHLQLSSSMRSRCFQGLVNLCGEYGVLPETYLIPGSKIMKKGTKPASTGGFSDVWKGSYEKKTVAIKVIKYRTQDGIQTIRKSFCREVITLKRLCHPNILEFIGVTMDDESYVMITPWMWDGNIADYVRDKLQTNPLKLLEGATLGLHYLHSLDLAHGDLKGANILVDDGRAYLADVGLTRLAGDLSSGTNVTTNNTTTTVAFSVRWCPPEMLDPEKFGSKGRPTKKSDIYSMAMTVYEVLTGEVPYYDCRADITAMLRIVQGERPPKPIMATTRGCTEDLWEITASCWNADSTKRPTVDQVLEALKIAAEEWTQSNFPRRGVGFT